MPAIAPADSVAAVLPPLPGAETVHEPTQVTPLTAVTADPATDALKPAATKAATVLEKMAAWSCAVEAAEMAERPTVALANCAVVAVLGMSVDEW